MIDLSFMHVFGWLLLTINTISFFLLILNAAKYLPIIFIKGAKRSDITFYFLLFLLNGFIFLENIDTGYRNIDTFLLKPVKIDLIIAESTLLARVILLGAGVIIWMLGRKYKSDWYED